jgi:hypothetical protein
VSIRAVEISQKNSSKRGSERRVWRKSILGKTWLFDIPPSTPPCGCLDWGGVGKNGLQNLEGKPLRGHNLENK